MSGDIPLAAPDVPLNPGQIRFYHACRPALQAGDYRLRAKQSVDKLKGMDNAPSFEAEQPLTVSGPRFRLEPKDLQSVYPPADSVGHFDESLPHAVLRRKSLPWERTLDDSTAGEDADSPPWMALLSLYPDEAEGVTPSQYSVAELLKPGESGILPPSIDSARLSAQEMEEKLLAFDLDLAIFRQIAPALADLPWLAHVREVDTGNKEILGMDEDGWFSVVIGNRLAQAGGRNQVFLVSLEGHQDHLPGGGAIDPELTKIRLVCLARWAFTSAPARGDFLCLVRALEQRGGVGLLQPPHTPFDAGDESEAKEALEIGYLPLTTNTRSGETTSSWYRGPLTPVPTKPDGNGPYYFSDHAIRYDPETGLFNMAYAAAWQIGRLLALSDAPFARSLLEWRRGYYRQQEQQEEGDLLAESLPQQVLDIPTADAANQPRHALLAALPTLTGAAVPEVKPHAERGDDGILGDERQRQELRQRLADGEDPLDALLQSYLRGPQEVP